VDVFGSIHGKGWRVVGFVGLVLLGIPARGGIVDLTSQARSVGVRFTDGTPGQLKQAGDFGPFVARVGFPKVNAIADQNSTLSLTGDGGAFEAVSNVRGSSATAIFSSSFHVGFDVTRAVDYRLLYSFGASGTGTDVVPSAVFGGPFGTRDIHLGVSESGVLEPGAYQLQVDDVGGSNVTYSVSFAAVPLPGALWEILAMLPGFVVAGVVWRVWALKRSNRQDGRAA
jgi:hypothetical protein